MAVGIWRGVSNVARKVKKQYRGVNSVAREIKKEWRGISGVARLVYQNALLLYDSNGGGNGTTVSSKSSYINIEFPSTIDFSKYSKIYIDITSNQTKTSSYYPKISAYDNEVNWMFDVGDNTLGTITKNKRYTVIFDVSKKNGQIKYCRLYSTTGSGMVAWDATIHKIWLE